MFITNFNLRKRLGVGRLLQADGGDGTGGEGNPAGNEGAPEEKKVQVKKKVQKRKKNTRRHVKGEIISWEELENRTGLTGDETELLTVYLHKFERGEVHVRCSKKLKDLAEYIYETESLYIAKHGGFKLLEISSIETKLCNIRQEERERKEEDEKQVKKRVENKR